MHWLLKFILKPWRLCFFYRVGGDAIQHRAVDHSRRSIEALLEIKPDYAHLQKGEQLIKVRPAEVQVGGDLVVVKPGEKIPLDGRVVEGISYVDTAALTGESVERRVQPGEEVLSGFLNTSGVLLIEVLKEEAQSTISKILELVEHAGGDKKKHLLNNLLLNLLAFIHQWWWE